MISILISFNTTQFRSDCDPVISYTIFPKIIAFSVEVTYKNDYENDNSSKLNTLTDALILAKS